MGARDLPRPEKNENMAQIHRDMISIGQHLDDPGSIFFADGTRQIGDVESRAVDIGIGDMAIRCHGDCRQ